MSAPASRALAAAGVADLRDLSAMRRRDVAALHGVGPTVMRVLDAALADRGMAFAED
ncbi:DNA-binding protein [Euzebya sp.]|uniref:DNA-binding protein n=1 Tax=Euzebya sp. TaxID=1971409 RepID=UPI00355A6636